MRVLAVQSKKLFFIVRMIVYSLRMIGLAPFSISMKTSSQVNPRYTSIQAFQKSKVGLGYNLLIFVVLILRAGFLLAPWFSSFSATESSTTELAVFVVEHSFCNLTAGVVIISWGIKQKDAASIMNRLLEVDVRLSGMRKQSFNKRALVFSVIHLILNFYLWISYCSGRIRTTNFHDFALSFLDFLQIFIVYCFTFEYFIIVGLAATNLQTVNSYLLELKEIRNFLSRLPSRSRRSIMGGLLPNHSSQLAYLETLYSVRSTLTELCGDIDDFFSLPIFFCVAAGFVPLVNRVYNLFYFVANEYNSTQASSLALEIILMYIYPIMSLAVNVTRATSEAQLTGQIVHKLLAVVVNQEIKTELEKFSVQLLHENAGFSACGIFSLDCTLLQSVNILKHI